ncbi:hypothetical protein PRIPAC_95663 [Pristionchus pacificus]|uniref:Uncharacterized protein n=1 Tax=Pristionchus pacificus TaxID=54126 RepID=A0A2A6BJW8_PRIPA|nr:hypothetical protein PRIPAC_95663 [Pristionchus pacificus]|eukprot:PDM66210.1 hypothetical protein PRIPAC_45435 [Pristionchus pacificus]
MHSSLLVALALLSVAVSIQAHAGAKFGNVPNSKQCPANVQRLLGAMCRDKQADDFCDTHVSSLTKLVEKYSTFDVDVILGGECCSEKRCRLSVLRSLCCIDGLRVVSSDDE